MNVNKKKGGRRYGRLPFCYLRLYLRPQGGGSQGRVRMGEYELKRYLFFKKWIEQIFTHFIYLL
ncbi:MAG: hypothetical protein MJ192_09490, partial [Clostridia bacterium]|nr:hypothetical protein [Clostridia bacterium]